MSGAAQALAARGQRPSAAARLRTALVSTALVPPRTVVRDRPPVLATAVAADPALTVPAVTSRPGPAPVAGPVPPSPAQPAAPPAPTPLPAVHTPAPRALLVDPRHGVDAARPAAPPLPQRVDPVPLVEPAPRTHPRVQLPPATELPDRVAIPTATPPARAAAGSAEDAAIGRQHRVAADPPPAGSTLVDRARREGTASPAAVARGGAGPAGDVARPVPPEQAPRVGVDAPVTRPAAPPPVTIGEIHVHVAAPPAAGPDPLALLTPYAHGLTARRDGPR